MATGGGPSAACFPALPVTSRAWRPCAAARAPAPPPQQRTLDELAVQYASQLQQLNDMGFYDRDAILRMLEVTGGNVQAALERLLR